MKTIIKYALFKGVTVGIILFPFFSAYAESDVLQTVVEPVSVTNVLQIFFWLVIIILIIVLLTWMLKKISGININSSGTIKIVTSIHVGQREKVTLVQVGDKQILLGITPSSITNLHVMENNIELTEQTSNINYGTFAEKLRNAMNKEKNNR